jgi:hypothetical protein
MGIMIAIKTKTLLLPPLLLLTGRSGQPRRRRAEK